MLSNNQIKFIKSLEHKKYRKLHDCFVVEGEKMVLELLDSTFEVMDIFATKSFIIDYFKVEIAGVKVTEISDNELTKISFLHTPNKVLAVVKLPTQKPIEIKTNELILGIDSVQDPGNLGTIIRTAGWFGITQIYCSLGTVDAYSPKVVQSTMGSIFRVNIAYLSILDVIEDAKKMGIPVIGTLLSGKNMYHFKLPSSALIIMGNESKGVSPALQSKLDIELLIPPFPENSLTTESLNVSVATALVCAEFRRQQFIQS
jgi:TrmH family RNA methyltransferase